MTIPVWRRATKWGDRDPVDNWPSPKNPIRNHPENISQLLNTPEWRDSSVKRDGDIITVTHRTTGAVARVFANPVALKALPTKKWREIWTAHGFGNLPKWVHRDDP